MGGNNRFDKEEKVEILDQRYCDLIKFYLFLNLKKFKFLRALKKT